MRGMVEWLKDFGLPAILFVLSAILLAVTVKGLADEFVHCECEGVHSSTAKETP